MIALRALVHGFAVLMLDLIFVSEYRDAEEVIATWLPAVFKPVPASAARSVPD